MACRIEDAGFEIRDMLAWVYGSGFPKSLDVSKAIDKAAGAEREVVGRNPYFCEGRTADPGEFRQGGKNSSSAITAPATDAAREWAGWGTALKPALEPITMARKPLVGTVAANVLEYGTGGLNIDACRVGSDADWTRPGKSPNNITGKWGSIPQASTGGRWPANLIHDGSDEVLALMPMTGKSTGGDGSKFTRSNFGMAGTGCITEGGKGFGDSGSAARFFYCAKASKREREQGCDGMPLGPPPASARSTPADGRTAALGAPRGNHHPTVKPIALMEYLCKLASAPGAVVLDPFMGSGTTGIACRNLGREFIGIERDADYFEIARNRIEHTPKQMEIPA
jgi:site-specific DNA-methyltransferase (adenine-specific)